MDYLSIVIPFYYLEWGRTRMMPACQIWTWGICLCWFWYTS